MHGKPLSSPTNPFLSISSYSYSSPIPFLCLCTLIPSHSSLFPLFVLYPYLPRHIPHPSSPSLQPRFFSLFFSIPTVSSVFTRYHVSFHLSHISPFPLRSVSLIIDSLSLVPFLIPPISPWRASPPYSYIPFPHVNVHSHALLALISTLP